MDKTAIKNFAIWARNKLKEDIKVRAGFMGITENGIAEPLQASTFEIQYFDVASSEPVKLQGREIEMRRSIVSKLEQHAKESGYQTAYDSLIENMASEWFNRLIAIRYMEVNDYFSDGLRVLSSVQEGKQDPDIVTKPFDSDLEFSNKERTQINEWLDHNSAENLFKFLLFKRCNQLAKSLPGLFEKTGDASEFFLRIGFVEKDGFVYRLVHDIAEEDWKDQVQIIGWMYQYYNSEFKDQTFAELKKTKSKVKKEQIAPVTQLFTPDWIVRYMVENSLGRIWLEGHPDDSLKEKWKYYLDEAEQDSDVKFKLDEIREEYKTLTPEDLTFIDPCSGSGHILVYAFDVLMQIYETQGYTPREATRAILEKNIYGIDIDERAYQLSYFALMMKAREYDRRILDRGIKPHVYCIEESNPISTKQLEYFGASMEPTERKKASAQIISLLDVFHDAKEYGSILTMPKFDYELLKRFVTDSNYVQLSMDTIAYDNFGLDDAEKFMIALINQGEILSNKYWITCTNPPYMAVSNGSSKMQDYVKKNYPDSKSDLFSVFIERCGAMTRNMGYQAMITMHSWMFLSSFEKLREKLQQHDIVNMAHLGARAFEEIGGEVAQTTAFVMRNNYLKDYKGTYCRLVGPNTQQGKEDMFLAKENFFIINQANFKKIPGRPIAYWVSKVTSNIFENKIISDIYEIKQGLATCNNNLFLRNWFEVSKDNINFLCGSNEETLECEEKWYPYTKGGGFRKWYGNNFDVVNWYHCGRDIHTYSKLPLNYGGAPVRAKKFYFKPGITYGLITSSAFSARNVDKGFIFDVGGSMIFPNSNSQKYLLGLLNSKIVEEVLKILNPTLNYQVGDIGKIPVIIEQKQKKIVENLTKTCIELSKLDWNSFETSWDFSIHPLISVIAKNQMLFDDTTNIDIAECYMCWENECNDCFNKLKSNEEELNRIFIEIYGLQDELSPEEEDKDVTVRKADLQRDIRSLLSYAVGCMFGRYSLSTEGLVYAGGEWDSSKYSRFMPDEDNVIPITDQKYMDDDIVERFCEFLVDVYGEKSLETNLDFIANTLGGKGSTSREIIRNYFLNDFFKDHCKIYQKRPIYWLFDSGKQNSFKALVYMHRWDKNTIGRVLVYLHKIQEKYEIEVRAIDAMLEHMTDKRQQAVEEQRRDHLLKQIAEIKEYDESLDHMTNEHIDIDLDDGVKVNYEKVQTDRSGTKFKILAPIK